MDETTNQGVSDSGSPTPESAAAPAGIALDPNATYLVGDVEVSGSEILKARTLASTFGNGLDEQWLPVLRAIPEAIQSPEGIAQMREWLDATEQELRGSKPSGIDWSLLEESLDENPDLAGPFNMLKGVIAQQQQQIQQLLQTQSALEPITRDIATERELDLTVTKLATMNIGATKDELKTAMMMFPGIAPTEAYMAMRLNTKTAQPQAQAPIPAPNGALGGAPPRESMFSDHYDPFRKRVQETAPAGPKV